MNGFIVIDRSMKLHICFCLEFALLSEKVREMNQKKSEKIRCPIMGFLVRRVVDSSIPFNEMENRTRLGMLAGWVSTLLSILLCLIKGGLGWFSGSISLMADAMNNLTDVGSSLIISLGFLWSRKPGDEKHPFGHGRIEAIITLVMAIALLLVGFGVAKSGVLRLFHPKPILAPGWLLFSLGITIVVKLWMAVFATKLARLSGSHVLEVDAWNHIYDVASTLLVVVGLMGSKLGWIVLDAWMAIVVALLILGTGLKYAREAIDILLGEKPDPKDVRAIYQIVSSIPEVFGVHEIMLHQYGDIKMVSFHIEVPASLNLIKAHELAEQAERTVEEQLGWRALAHIDPVDRSHPLFNQVYEDLKRFMAKHSSFLDFHDLRIQGEKAPYHLSFDWVVRLGTPRMEYSQIYQETINWVEHTFPEKFSTLEIGIEAILEITPMERKTFCILSNSSVEAEH